MTGCRVVTIRYYEKEGLLNKPPRSAGGYRLYTMDDVERLRFILHCRSHGMGLSEIKVLLKLRENPDHDCSLVGEMVDKHIDQVERQIESLKHLKNQLIRLRKKCSHSGQVGSCGIMRGLTDKAECGCLLEDPDACPHSAGDS